MAWGFQASVVDMDHPSVDRHLGPRNPDHFDLWCFRTTSTSGPNFPRLLEPHLESTRTRTSGSMGPQSYPFLWVHVPFSKVLGQSGPGTGGVPTRSARPNRRPEPGGFRAFPADSPARRGRCPRRSEFAPRWVRSPEPAEVKRH